MQECYQHLLDLTEQVVAQAEQVQQHCHTQLEQQAERSTQRLADTLQTFLPRVNQVIEQIRRRVIEGESVPAGEKFLSLFEPHTAIIRKGKAGTPTEFGRVLWLGATAGGIISQARVLEGNPDDAAQVVPSLERHTEQCGHPPKLVVGDGKLATPANEQAALQRGVARVVLPRAGRKTSSRLAHERQRWFRRGRNWRAGSEGRINGLKRRHGLDRCRNHGDDGMKRWVGWGVITHDLRKIAEHQVEQAARQE